MRADRPTRLAQLMWPITSVGPAALLILVVAYIPIVFAIGMSFFYRTAFGGVSGFAGLENFEWLVMREEFWSSFGRSVTFTTGAVGLQILLGLVFGLLLNESFRGRGAARSLALLPYLLPTIVVGLVFKWILNPQAGIINQKLVEAGLTQTPVNFFGDPDAAMPAVVFVTAWQYCSFAALLILARLQSINPRLYEAARTCGAGPVRRFIDVTLPNLRTTLFLLALLRGVWMFNKFDLVWIITAGGPLDATETLPIFVYKLAFQEFDFGRAAAACSAMFLILCLASLCYFRIFQPTKEVAVGR